MSTTTWQALACPAEWLVLGKRAIGAHVLAAALTTRRFTHSRNIEPSAIRPALPPPAHDRRVNGGRRTNLRKSGTRRRRPENGKPGKRRAQPSAPPPRTEQRPAGQSCKVSVPKVRLNFLSLPPGLPAFLAGELLAPEMGSFADGTAHLLMRFVKPPPASRYGLHGGTLRSGDAAHEFRLQGATQLQRADM